MIQSLLQSRSLPSREEPKTLPPFTDMGRNLAQDSHATLQKQLLTQIQQNITTCNEHLEGGVAPEEYQKLKKYMNALKASQKIVNVVWNLHHHKKEIA